MPSRCSRWRVATREQVRFDYRRRDGDDSSRLVEPHQLVSTGRRWYLVAWDVRRDDWRTFRLDRLERPRLAGVRCAARELPGGDAAAFVAESIRTMPLPHSAVLEVDGAPDAVRDMLRWSDAEVEELDDGRAHVRVGSGSNEALLRIVTWLADGTRSSYASPTSWRRVSSSWWCGYGAEAVISA